MKRPNGWGGFVGYSAFCAGLLYVCYLATYKPRIETQWMKMEGPCFATYVWYHGQIIQSWYDPVETVTDSLKKARIKEGEKLIKEIENK